MPCLSHGRLSEGDLLSFGGEEKQRLRKSWYFNLELTDEASGSQASICLRMISSKAIWHNG